jgi:hypothetical protein
MTPIRKLPPTIPVPTDITQPAEPGRIGLYPPLGTGLEIEQDWSVGRNPVPLTLI